MKIHRFIGDFDITKDSLVLTDLGLIHQMRDVLRLAPGEHVALSDGKGSEAECEILAISGDAVEVGLCSWKRGEAEPRRASTLYLAILKKDNFELAIAKAVELGVSRIVPIITERTVKHGLVRPRLEKIIKEAAEQSGRSVLPTLGDAVDFTDALASLASPDHSIFFFHTAAGGIRLVDSRLFSAQKPLLFVGPEGGWTDAEAEAAQAVGAATISLGPTVLRAETAAMIATYLGSSYSLD